MQEILANAVTVYDGQPCTTSLKIAEIFGKEHRNIIRAIRKLEIPEDFGLLNFKPSDYLNAQNKKQPMYQITRDGFTLLAMGFTGKAAMQFKVAYIREFNRMAAELAKQPALPALPVSESSEMSKVNFRMSQIAQQITNLMGVVRGTHPMLPNGFIPPTVGDVAYFCELEGITNVDPQRFVDYYNSRNWTRGQRSIPMVNWYDTVEAWSRNGKAVAK